MALCTLKWEIFRISEDDEKVLRIFTLNVQRKKYRCIVYPIYSFSLTPLAMAYDFSDFSLYSENVRWFRHLRCCRNKRDSNGNSAANAFFTLYAIKKYLKSKNQFDFFVLPLPSSLSASSVSIFMHPLVDSKYEGRETGREKNINDPTNFYLPSTALLIKQRVFKQRRV